MARRVFDYEADLGKPVRVQSLESVLSLSDDGADCISVHLVSNGNPLYTYDGNVRGRVLRPDGKTFVFDSQDMSPFYYITLPAEAYEIPGIITISAVYEKENSYSTTVLILTAYVQKTVSNDVTDLDAE